MRNLFESAIILLTCGMFFACSSDNTVAPEIEPTLTGGTAYLTVKIKYANDQTTRALGGYENATDVEKAIKTIHFYFYDNDGKYITSGTPFALGSDDTTDAASGSSIQFERTGVVALHGLNGPLPTQMLCVVNQPSTLHLEWKTFNEANGAITVASNAISETDKGFVMTSTAYAGNNGIGGCAVVLEPEDFLLDTDHKHETENPVDVYVERVAAKVEMCIDNAKLAAVSANTYFLTSVELDGESKDFYVELLKWGLNVTSKKYTPYKRIDKTAAYFDGWDGSAVKVGGNTVNLCRSYWGEAPYYSDGDAELYAANETEAENEAKSLKHVVEYTSWNGLGTGIGEAGYCAPNTRSLDVLSGHYTNRTTNVLVKARLKVADGGVYKPVDVCRFAGRFYTPGHFKAYVLGASSGVNRLWRSDGTGIRRVSVDDLEYYNVGDGRAGVQFTADAVKTGEGGVAWYTAEEYKDGMSTDGKTVAYDSASKCYLLTATTVPARQSFAGFEVDYYNEGMMYYSIPIEHNLAPTRGNYRDADYVSGTHDSPKNGKYAQVGDYGIVRNHAYIVTITKISNFGHAVYHGDHLIVPNDNDAREYWLGADINVLAWHTVTQSVDQ